MCPYSSYSLALKGVPIMGTLRPKFLLFGVLQEPAKLLLTGATGGLGKRHARKRWLTIGA